MKTISVTCHTEHSLDYRELRDFQGDLKTRTVDDIHHVMDSIRTHGFSFPVYVWKHIEADAVVYDIIDGHGRLEAIQALVKEGYEIPPVPVVFIEASDRNDAAERLLQVNTVSSPFSETGLQDLVLDIPDVTLSNFTLPQIDTKSLGDSIALLRNALTQIDEMTPEKETPSKKEKTKTSKTQEIVVQCTGCGKSFTHIVQS